MALGRSPVMRKTTRDSSMLRKDNYHRDHDNSTYFGWCKRIVHCAIGVGVATYSYVHPLYGIVIIIIVQLTTYALSLLRVVP